MIIHISMWKNRGGGTAVARLLAKLEGTAGLLLFLESDKQKVDKEVPQVTKETAIYFLDFLRTLRFVGNLLKSNRVVLLHSHGRRAGWHSRLCRLYYGKRVLIVHSFHGIASMTGIKKFISTLSESMLSTLTDAVIADGKAELELFKKIPRLFCPAHRIMPAYDKNNLIHRQITSIRRIGFAARMDKGKLHNELITLIATFNSKHPHNCLKLILCGDGPNRDNILNFAKNILAHNFEYLGFVDQIVDFYAEIDAYAHFSKFEGLPVSLVEAMASGLPCIATNVIGCKDALEIPGTGMLVKPGGLPEQLASIEKLVFNFDETMAMATFAKKSAIKRFSPDTFKSSHEIIFKEIGYL
jgi:glycosyltransferase involved in cell wall biosynthesis